MNMTTSFYCTQRCILHIMIIFSNIFNIAKSSCCDEKITTKDLLFHEQLSVSLSATTSH